MNKLTKKEKNFVKEYVKTGHGVESVLKTYDTKDYSTAGNIASENLKKPKIIDAIMSIAERIPDELLEKVHLEGLVATKISSIRKLTPDGPEDIEEPDYATRHKYLDSAYKLKGSYAPDKNININMNVKTIDPTDETILNSLKAIQDKLENDTAQ